MREHSLKRSNGSLPRRVPSPSRRVPAAPRPVTPSGLRRATPSGPGGNPDGRVARVQRALRDHRSVERLSRTFRALGDPTRSKLVLALSLEELCVTELAGALGASLSATSHQLRILRDLDIVRVRRNGKSQVYALNEQAFGFCSPRSCHAWQQIDTGSLVAIEHRAAAGAGRRSSAPLRGARAPRRAARRPHPGA